MFMTITAAQNSLPFSFCLNRNKLVSFLYVGGEKKRKEKKKQSSTGHLLRQTP